MREILLIAIVVVVSGVGLFRPTIALSGYIWFALMRPDVLAYAYRGFPFSLLLAISTFIGSIRLLPRLSRVLTNPFVILLLIFQIPVVMSVVVNAEPASEQLFTYQRTIIMALLIPLIIQTEQDLKLIFLVITFSLGLIGAKYGILGAAHGGIRITQGLGGMMSGNNELGLAFTMIVPFCWYARELVTSRWLRFLLVVMALGSMAAVVFTYSRGASIGLAASLLLMVYRSKRRAGPLLVMAGAAAIAVYLVGDTYLDRMATIKDPEQEASARQRLEQNVVAYAMWQDHPLMGVGFGGQNYLALTGRYEGNDNIHIVHNTYLQLMVESGLFAALIYAVLLIATIVWLQISLRTLNPDARQRAYAMAMQTSLIAFAIVIPVHPRLRYDFYYMLIMLAAAWFRIHSNVVDNAESAVTVDHEDAMLAVVPGN